MALRLSSQLLSVRLLKNKMSEKIKRKLFLGIDTSNYTTSVAVADEEGNVIANIKKMLPVAEGERGLRQSDAVFHHTKNLPYCMDELGAHLSGLDFEYEIAAIGVSAYPRNCEGSYMPCFLCGISAAHSISSVTGAPIYKFSHQCGHIRAAIYSSGNKNLLTEKFGAFHISGGTTDLLLVEPRGVGFDITRIGGSLDMNAGQAIDRTGVMMGLTFPCGKEMESLASRFDGEIKGISVSVKGVDCNLSGLENKAAKLYYECGDKAKVSAYVFDFIGKTLYKMSENFRAEYSNLPLLFAGGVMSNGKIKAKLARLPDTYFSEPQFSADNAAGIALMVADRYFSK